MDYRIVITHIIKLTKRPKQKLKQIKLNQEIDCKSTHVVDLSLDLLPVRIRTVRLIL